MDATFTAATVQPPTKKLRVRLRRTPQSNIPEEHLHLRRHSRLRVLEVGLEVGLTGPEEVTVEGGEGEEVPGMDQARWLWWIRLGGSGGSVSMAFQEADVKKSA
ncbi:hypothetical protein HPP92_000729 [Vanilla planifolia]|uniref:Uncharacterized protein n=1 Tax=Vanilla planifolia TaxID=51239 RepID=A0A835S1X8_VANPL|nr:hypothetical protein HPP92_000729 [Vanilla planifolia]